MLPKPLDILISPLDWGLGHAARCIPVISELIKAGHKVTLAGYGRSLIMLRKEFPLLECIELKGFSPSYARSGNMVLHLFLLLPRFIKTIIYEHRDINKLIEQFHFDIIISDNRYGLWNKSVTSILITHQIMIKTPGWLRFAEYFLYLVCRLMISRFDECWIPDEKEGPGMSGDLSHKYALPANAKFIRPLSRFQKPEPSYNKADNDIKIIAIISGPEPQRSIFEQLVTKQLRGLKEESMIIGGKPESTQTSIINTNLTILPYLETAGLKSAISEASLVVCRSGYSSIMDMQALGAKALFVPTPGQTEQIYLAKLHQQAGSVLWCDQENMNLESNIPEALQFPGFKPKAGINGLSAAIADLKKK